MNIMRASVDEACGCETVALTDETTDFPMSAFRFPTSEPKLMLWILEVSLAYLKSEHFDRPTVFVSPDVLVLSDLRPYFKADLTILVRTAEKYHERPIVNVMQWWPMSARERLIRFYQQALNVARVLPEESQKWGADSDAIRVLLEPLNLGVHKRSGLKVAMVEASSVVTPLSSGIMHALDAGESVGLPSATAIDFKCANRKPYMARVWRQVAA